MGKLNQSLVSIYRYKIKAKAKTASKKDNFDEILREFSHGTLRESLRYNSCNVLILRTSKSEVFFENFNKPSAIFRRRRCLVSSNFKKSII